MIKVTREHKYETILEWWLEGWEDERNDVSILADELLNLHTGNKPLWQFDDEELDKTYKEAIAWLKEFGGHE